MQKHRFRVGQRIQIGAERATVRYVGAIDGQSGEWAGLEWDNEARGKHDGSVKGRRYFECIYAEQAGTFVRMPKLLQTAQTGHGVLAGLQARYQGIVGTASHGGGAIDFRLIGEQAVRSHQGQLQLLESASLAGDCISSLGSEEELAAAAPALAELGLASTLVDSWEEALRIAAALPALRLFDLSHTRMELPSAPDPALAPLPLLQTLVLNDCRLSWSQAVSLGPSLPRLRELYLCGNQISALDSLDPCASKAAFPRLQVLDLADNCIPDWHHVRQLSRMTSLQSLNVSSNQLGDLAEPLATGLAFSELQALLLASNNVSSWDTVQALSELPSLRDVRLSGNPLFTSGDGGRSQVVARMSGLTLLNGSTVDKFERRDAELHYLRGLLADVDGRADKLRELEGKHPQLAPLRTKYGEMDGTGRSLRRDPAAGTMAHDMLRLHLVRLGSSGKDDPPSKLTKDITGTITLRNLQYLMWRLHKVPMTKQRLSVREPPSQQLRSLEGKDPTLSLAALDVMDSSEILVEMR